MRYLRIFTVIIFVFSLLFAGWTNHRYSRNLNTDYPEITGTGDLLEISVKDPADAIYRGLHAQDATDGDLTGQIMVASMSHFLEPGTVRVKYVVFDSHNNSATLTRRVRYTDYEAPVFSLDKAPVYTVGSSFDLLEHIRVEDAIDGDITDHIRVISSLPFGSLTRARKALPSSSSTNTSCMCSRERPLNPCSGSLPLRIGIPPL